MTYIRLTPLFAIAVSMLSFGALSQSAGPNWKLEDNQRHVTVTFPTTPPVAMQLDVGGIEDGAQSHPSHEWGSLVLRPAISMVSIGPQYHHDHPPGDPRALA